jgi:hypothetical protein
MLATCCLSFGSRNIECREQIGRIVWAMNGFLFRTLDPMGGGRPTAYAPVSSKRGYVFGRISLHCKAGGTGGAKSKRPDSRAEISAASYTHDLTRRSPSSPDDSLLVRRRSAPLLGPWLHGGAFIVLHSLISVRSARSGERRGASKRVPLNARGEVHREEHVTGHDTLIGWPLRLQPSLAITRPRAAAYR